MSFEEWFLTNAFAEYPDHESLEKFQDCWKAAQEDMRERAAIECDKLGISDDAESCAQLIRALPIEV